MDSDLARTAIFAVKNGLSYLGKDKTVRVLKSLVPPESGPTPKVTVFKELVRLFAEYTHLPGMSEILPALWSRERLHKDVRLVLMQSVVALLSDKNSEVSEMAWKIATDCATSELRAPKAGMVLAMVVREAHKDALTASSFLSLVSPPYTYYQYGELVTIVRRTSSSSPPFLLLPSLQDLLPRLPFSFPPPRLAFSL